LPRGGRTLYVACGRSGAVSVIDTEKNGRLSEVAVWQAAMVHRDHIVCANCSRTEPVACPMRENTVATVVVASKRVPHTDPDDRATIQPKAIARTETNRQRGAAISGLMRALPETSMSGPGNRSNHEAAYFRAPS
jgi:YVTN family beta-propeller protein